MYIWEGLHVANLVKKPIVSMITRILSIYKNQEIICLAAYKQLP